MAFGCVKYDWKPFVRGTDWSRTLTFTTSGAVEVLTGYSAVLTIKDKPHSAGTTILTVTSSSPTANGSLITITGSAGQILISLTDVDTAAFNWTTAYYDLKLTGPAGGGSLESVPLYGKFTIIQNIGA